MLGVAIHRVPGVRARVRAAGPRAGAGGRGGPARPAAARQHGLGAAARRAAATPALHLLHTRHLQVSNTSLIL